MIHVPLETRILPDHLSHLLRISTLDSIQHDHAKKLTLCEVERKEKEKEKKKKQGHHQQ